MPLALETLFVQSDADEASLRASVTEALRGLGREIAGGREDWRIGNYVRPVPRRSRGGLEVWPPSTDAVPPPAAWSLAHALQHAIADVHVEPTFAGDVDPRPATAPTRESAVEAATAPPSDERWHFARIRLQPEHRALGAGVRIGHPDTGYTKHDEIWAAIDVEHAANLMDPGQSPIDPLRSGPVFNPGHGTATASMMVARDGVRVPDGPRQIDLGGITPRSSVVPIRVTDSVVILGWQRRLAEAIEHAVDAGCRVISMSLGGIGGSRLDRAIEYAESKGTILIAAAGNKVGFVTAPATHPLVVACAATDVNDRPWSGSSHGPAVSISAPGHQVWVADWSDQHIAIGRTGSGTSYATAIVASAAALWCGRYATDLAARAPSTVPGLFRTALARSAQKLASLPETEYGAGLLDVTKLLETPPGSAVLAESVSELPTARSSASISFAALVGASRSEFPASAALDPTSLAELVFHLTVDPALRAAWKSGLRITPTGSPVLARELRSAAAPVSLDMPPTTVPPVPAGTPSARIASTSPSLSSASEVRIRIDLEICIRVESGGR
jgi:hypothetical protein